MNCVRHIKDDLLYIGGSDRRLAKFENLFPLPTGVSYNSYLLLDDKTVLLDTVDHAVAGVFFENLEAGLAGRPLDYVIVQHMEPDHASTLQMLIRLHPEVMVVCSAIAQKMIGQFFGKIEGLKVQTVTEGDTLAVGSRSLRFCNAQMVHWPEVIMTYDPKNRALFSADAFGTFGALGGNLYADELDFEKEWLGEARRYYTNIVGKYGAQVNAVLDKLDDVEVSFICSLHGPVWRKNTRWYIDLYRQWADCAPEVDGVLVVYGSVYGHTQNAAEALAGRLADRGARVALYDVSVTDVSELVAEAWRFNKMVIACSTYNAGIFPAMETYLLDLRAHSFHSRTVAVIENGSWAPSAGHQIRKLIGEMKNMTLLEQTVHIKSAIRPEQAAELDALADALVPPKPVAMPAPAAAGDAVAAKAAPVVDPNALFKVSYGLFVLTARDGEKDNGCIINTVNQITNMPNRLAVAVNKLNYTHDLIQQTGLFNVSVLSRSVEFATFQRFGYQSGRNVDKFAGLQSAARSQNGLYYLTEACNALISCKVIATHDYETHTLFIAELTEARILSDETSVTYDDYMKHIKPKPKAAAKTVRGFRCKICGYIYEGDTLPPDYICPVCKHPASDFEPVGFDTPKEVKPHGYRCKICGYIYEGDTLPPDFICPVCKHPASDFEKIT
ncbi:MAG TPA: flavin reductase [Candidatus Limiplasma sp.]|nr:flavin reductase [Candidatus Limiplasma sp.]HPS81288.1 flavin reductase [Candidatus Limiplasma sp.]